MHEDTLADVPDLAVETHDWAAGTLFSNADDVIRFVRALFDGTRISDHALAETTDTSTAEHGLGPRAIPSGSMYFLEVQLVEGKRHAQVDLLLAAKVRDEPGRVPALGIGDQGHHGSQS